MFEIVSKWALPLDSHLNLKEIKFDRQKFEIHVMGVLFVGS